MKALNVIDVQYAVANYFNLPLQEMTNGGRQAHVCLARHIAMYLSRRHTVYSLKSIALEFGRTDHTTVIYAMKAVQDRADTDSTVRRQVAELQQRIEHLTQSN